MFYTRPLETNYIEIHAISQMLPSMSFDKPAGQVNYIDCKN
jgi:hypothetical protein